MGEAIQVNKRLFPGIHRPDGTFRTSGYRWLGSDWKSPTWEILDIDNPGLESETINFDVPAMPDHTFMDLPEIVEDIRRSIVIAVELRKVLDGQGAYCGSRSATRRFGQCLLRVYREILDMGFQSPSDIDEGHISELRDHLLYPERISRAYPEKLLQLIEELGIHAVPVKIIRSRKWPCHVDKDRLQLMAGIGDFRNSGECKQIINDLTQELAEQHPEYRWVEPEAFDHNDYASKVQARNHVNALNLLYAQSQLLPDDFAFPLHRNPFPGKKEIPAIFVERSFAENGYPTRPCRGRTRNMPVPVFLGLMDAAVRWVIDYAEPLLNIKEQVVTEFNEFRGNLGNDQASRLANMRVRELSSESEWAGKPASPFPLASFRHYRRAPESKYDDDFIAEVQTLLDQGLGAAEAGDRLGITKSSIEYVQYRFIEDRFSHDLPTTGVSLNYALYGYLPFCCAVILLAFTAGRESSIGDLRYGCIKRIAGLRYINLYIPKTLRRYEDLPTVELVEKAVAVLERLSATARKKTGSDRLFQFGDLVGDRVKGVRFDAVYSNFFDLIDMPKDEDGAHWKLSEHQFRRFFAIMYFYRYGKENDSDFESLMYYLRHCDWTMTDRYLTEREQGRIFREVEEEWLAHTIVTGKPSDQSLRDLLTDIDDVKSSVVNNTKIVREKDYERALKRVQDEDLVFEFLSFGAVCLGLSPGRSRVAKCAIEKDGEFATCVHKASEDFCKGCPNLVECDSLISSKLPEPPSLTTLACGSPLLDAVLLEVESVDG